MEKEPREGIVDFSLLEAFIRSVEKFLQTVEEAHGDDLRRQIAETAHRAIITRILPRFNYAVSRNDRSKGRTHEPNPARAKDLLWRP
jgi:hypothetical protein